MKSQVAENKYKISALAPAPGSARRFDREPAGADRHTLLRLQLHGHYALSDNRLVPCRTLHIDPYQIALTGEVNGSAGEVIRIDLNLLGSLKGRVEARTAAGLRVVVADVYKDHIADKLQWFKSHLKEAMADPEALPFKARAHERIVPRQTQCHFVAPNGSSNAAIVANISPSGAALKSAFVPQVGEQIYFGVHNRRGVVVRHFDGGFAIAFLLPIAMQDFGPNMLL